MFIKVYVVTDAKREHIEETAKGEFTVHVKVSAERNMANKKVLELLGNAPSLAGYRFRLVHGHHQPNKLINCIQKTKL